jgi:hypothetical protein
MPMNEEKDSELIMQLVRKLFFVTLTQLEYLEKRDDVVMAQRAQLDTIEPYTLDDQGLLDLRRDVSQIIGAEAYSELFDKSVVTKLEKAYANLPTPELGGQENMLQFQLGVLILRLCSDYVNAIDIYQRHSEGFRQQLPRIFIRNDVTGEIDWLAARDAMAALLEKNFRERYESAEERNGSFFRKTMVANEGFVIARRVIRESAEVMPIHSSASGIDYERHCGNQLHNQGFSVEYTKQSGDFGVDIIASKDGLR